MKRFIPEAYMDIESISMDDIEEFYSTGILRKKTESVISITAPLIVCLALHGRLKLINELLKKYPMVDASGWTPELAEEERICGLCAFTMIDRTGEQVCKKMDRCRQRYYWLFLKR